MLLPVSGLREGLAAGLEGAEVNLLYFVLLLVCFEAILSGKSFIAVLARVGVDDPNPLARVDMLVVVVNKVLSLYKVPATVGEITYLSFSFKLYLSLLF